jgi:hypothetical protein
MSIETIYLLIAILPLTAYLMLLGCIRFFGRVLITTGGRDIAALGFGIAGLIAIGPGELFFPKAAAGVFGPWVWFALITFYSLIVSLIALVSRPRIVIYGRMPEQLVEPLHAACLELDSGATVDRERRRVMLPKSGVQLRVSGHTGLDSASIESFEPIAAARFWQALLGHLREKVQATDAPTPRRGGLMVSIAVVLAAFVIWQAIEDREQVVNGFRQWLWR